MAVGYGIYGGVGIPSQTQGQQSQGSPIQSFNAQPDSSGAYYAAPANASQGVQGAAQGEAGSTMNSGFYGLGGASKADYYLPSSANRDLYSQTLDPFQMSAKLGGGQIRSEDIGALRQAQNNSQDSSYSAFASHGIDPTSYLNDYNAGGYQDAGRFFQDQSQRGAVQGAKYNIDPSFGLRGSIGDLNFDVMGLDSNWNAPAAFNAWNPYLENDGIDRSTETMQAVAQGVGSIRNNGGSRGYQFQGVNPYDSNGAYTGYQGSYRSPSVQNQYALGGGLNWVG